MELKLSKITIESFCGDVLPLRLLGVEPYSQLPIAWSCDSDILSVTTYSNDLDDGGFTDGVLLTLLKPGSAVVTAQLEDQTFTCCVKVREMVRDVSRPGLNYYIGDFHDHTYTKHKKAEFVVREPGVLPLDYINQVKEEGLLDFGVVSDHACVLNDREFYRGFADAEDAQPMDLVILPGSEAEISALEEDRFGLVHKNAGEIVTVHCAGYANVKTWEDFFAKYEGSPFAVSALAHPQISGYSTNGIWNFCLHKNNSPRFRQMVKMVEMGDGTSRSSNLINEHTYSVALDNRFRVSTTCSSDSHNGWGYHRFPGKTVIMAGERSKEAFLDAIQGNRIYGCESGNVKIYYEVNGVSAPAELSDTASYDFRVELSYFHDDPTTHPVICQVISDYGKCLLEIPVKDAEPLSFTVNSDTARYFYLRFMDEEGRKTWSPPVWTGREIDPPCSDTLIPLAKEGFTATDVTCGADASLLINDDPQVPWISTGTTCSILLDMQTEHKIAALGHYPRILFRRALEKQGYRIQDFISEYPVRYKLFTGNDANDLKETANGLFRVFGGEELVRFPEHTARYVRLDILDTAGRFNGRKEFFDAHVAIGELTIFTKG